MNTIRELRKQNSMSQKELAEICGVHQTAVSQWEKGRTQPDMQSLKMLAKIFGVSVDKLLNDAPDEPAEDNRIPVFDFANAAELCARLGEKEYFALNITDDSMSPAMLKGDMILIARSPDLENGDFAAVAIGSGNAIIRKIIKKDTSIMLVSENTNYEPLIFSKAECETLPLFILGKAIELRRKL